ncbi:hypothetical protein B296_00049024 [Ensete ventricosum]|uniref:Uncharacterized protein n=1 Tax=Ensete ventricosum TaxID=4639 RepID=A0A426XH15_ENSVE|nr:hypothetical protein B296_00049024 [Ensete ventricosum]
MKVLMSKEGRRKDAPPAVTPRKATPQGAPRKEGSSRQRDKVVSWPRYMRDLCKVRAQSYNEPFLTWEMTDLRSCLGNACSKLAGLQVMLDNTAKNLVSEPPLVGFLPHVFSASLKEEADLVAIATAKAWASEATQQLEESQRRETEA